MSVTTLPALTPRDRSVLRAVAAGRCSRPGPSSLTVDGMALADQFAGLRLLDAGLITAAAGPVALTADRRSPADRRLTGRPTSPFQPCRFTSTVRSDETNTLK